MKKIVITAILLLISSHAVADLKVFITPPSWIVNTSTTDNIEKYLSDIKYNQSFMKNDARTNELKKISNKYREILKQKISTKFDTKNTENVKKICKISIATVKSSVQDKSPPDIILLRGEADNKSEFCVLASQKIQKLLDEDISLQYPRKLKERDMYAVSMLFVFDGEKQSSQSH